MCSSIDDSGVRVWMMEKWKGCFLLETWRANGIVCLWRLDGEIESEVVMMDVLEAVFVLSVPSEFYGEIRFISSAGLR